MIRQKSWPSNAPELAWTNSGQVAKQARLGRVLASGIKSTQIAVRIATPKVNLRINLLRLKRAVRRSSRLVSSNVSLDLLEFARRRFPTSS